MKQTKILKRYFDTTAEKWHSLYSNIKRSTDLNLYERKNIAISFLCNNLKRGSHILDVGCGAGAVALDAAKKGYIIYGIDISRKMVDKCNQIFIENNIEKAMYDFKVGNYPINSGPNNKLFDCIIALGFLEYQEFENKTIESFYKHLKPGGIIICSGPQRISISNFFGVSNIIRKRRVSLKCPHHQENSYPGIHKYSLSKFKALVGLHMFKIIDYKRHGYSDIFFITKIIGVKGEFFVDCFLTKISNYLPIDKFASNIVVVAKKDN